MASQCPEVLLLDPMAPLPSGAHARLTSMFDPVAEFASGYSFDFDAFQLDASEALARGESVLVAAPTGSGKTVVGEFAVWLALSQGGKAFYTTPLKALSNQKFGDLSKRYGADKVGLLTGDNAINPAAPVVVMTTEVLRNMIYERSDLLEDLRYVVLDEVHYLQDRYRGAVWEEVIIHLPVDVKIVSLSATVSNAEEFAHWIETLRGPTTAIIEEERPVELELHYLVEGELHPMFTGPEEERIPNPQIRRVEGRSLRHGGGRSRSRGHHSSHHQRRFPRRTDVIEMLSSEGMLPAIYFIFSRKGCNVAVSQVVREGIRLTDSTERARIKEYAELRCSYLAKEDLEVLGYHEWLEALAAGVASHHAGMIPVFKETVEELFQSGLVKVAFATETLSLGINMPARTVVIESLNKFTGERHEMLTPGEFTQLTGRAGRRGIDVLGHAVVPQQREITFQQIAGLASTRTYPLLSSFQPSYNMATNLIRNYSREEAEHLLNSSFAQYRADSDVVVLEQLIERNNAYLASYHQKMACDLGDFTEYAEMKDKVASFERSIARWESTAGREETKNVLSLARPGQVFVIPQGKLKGPVVVVGAERSKRGEPRVFAVTSSRKLIRLTAPDFNRAPRVAGRIPITFKEGSETRTWGSGRHIDPDTRRRLASALGSLDIPAEAYEAQPRPEEREGGELASVRQALIQHPCHDCPDRDRHAQWAERATRLKKENDGLRKRVRARTETLSRKLERVLSVLGEFHHVEGFNLTPAGWVLARIYNENDLLIAEAMNRGWFEELGPAEMAAIASTFVFESRGPFEIEGNLPTAATKRVYGKIVRLSDRIKRSESRLGLELTRGTETGFADTAYRWSNGATLDQVIDPDSTPGDFIRSSKQIVDLLRQLREVTANAGLAATLMEAADSINRSVVAYTGLV